MNIFKTIFIVAVIAILMTSVSQLSVIVLTLLTNIDNVLGQTDILNNISNSLSALTTNKFYSLVISIVAGNLLFRLFGMVS